MYKKELYYSPMGKRTWVIMMSSHEPHVYDFLAPSFWKFEIKWYEESARTHKEIERYYILPIQYSA